MDLATTQTKKHAGMRALISTFAFAQAGPPCSQERDRPAHVA
jgi:hypothetical protein